MKQYNRIMLGDHGKNRNYWKYLNAKLKKEQNEVVSGTTQLKLTASDGKKYNTDVISLSGVEKLAKVIPNNQAMAFLDWFKYSENTIDGQSRKKAYALWKSDLVADKDVGKVKALQQIELLAEMKQRIISDVVTGKFKVC